MQDVTVIGVALWAFLIATPIQAAEIKAKEALAEVNKRRAKLGLRPFKQDPLLTKAAMRAAKFRAKRGIEGHTSSDFQFLPKGARASAAGCAAWPRGMGWGSCCSDDNYKYAGAAFAVRKGVRYMHLFVR